MTTHTFTHGKGSWIETLKRAFSGLFRRRDSDAHPPATEARKTPLDDVVDMNSEDSFPASDPPSYTTGSSIT